MEEKDNKKINEFVSKNEINFGWNDDEELISGEELERRVGNERIMISEKLSSQNKSNKGRRIISMERFREKAYNAHLNNTLQMSYDEINVIHIKMYGCDFEPKF